MKNKINKFSYLLILLFLLSSCESYLDQAPEASITEKEVYGSFISFQGFVEEMYNCVTDYNKAQAWNPYLFADETLNNYPYPFDLGNYWSQSDLFYGSTANTNNEPRSKRIWPLCWYGIRKANLGLSKLELLTDATQEEKDFIKGQCLFFRGWFHFELMRYWGGLPYIDTLLSPVDDMKLPRLNYRETALKAAKDLRAAAELLPNNWDNTDAGQPTLGNNHQRITKIHALGFLGKDLLYAASPMMNEESTGKNEFDAELCKEAAEVFGSILKICDETGVYKLQAWNKWTDNFWVWSASNKTLNGGTEAIMLPMTGKYSQPRWSTVQGTVPVALGGGMSKNVEVPTHNFIKNYAMANGLPIDDPNSGYNPNDPWTGREPRFYLDIIIDGDQLVYSTAPDVHIRFAELYNGGSYRGTIGNSVSGYFYKKFSPIGCNSWDNKWASWQCYIPYLRLADIYLMYSESVLHGYGTPQSAAPNYMLTAEQALNIIRNRAQLPNLESKYTATKDAFMGELIRERAVELAFEAHRFCDLRRWNLNGDMKYREKTAIDFDRGQNGKPINLKERIVVTRVVEKKHNWLPFQVKFTTLYPEFPQNPGW